MRGPPGHVAVGLTSFDPPYFHRRERRSKAASRGGFTIFEMLLVLAVVVLIMSLAWPAIDSFRTEYRLRQGGQLVQSRLAAARVHAVETGKTYQFRFEPGGSRFVVLPTDYQALQSKRLAGQRTSKLAAVLPSTKAVFDSSSTGAHSTQAMPGDWLTGIPDAAQFADAVWSAPIYFYADGTATPATLVIRDEQSRMVHISVRQLTGSVTVSKITRGAR